MKKNLLFAAILAVSTVVSCNKDEIADFTESSSKDVIFGAAISRVSGNAFESGDEISVVAFDSEDVLFEDAATYTYSNGSFLSELPIKLPENSSLSYYASYPTQEGIEDSFDFSISTDQNSDDGYEKSDLLIAKVAASNSTSPTLQFSHTMSNLELIVKVVEDENEVDSPKISDLLFSALTTATCDISESTYTGSGSIATISPLETTIGSKYSMILAPQTIAAAEQFASITVDDVTYTWSPSSKIEFGSGLKYEYTWTIDRSLKTSEVTYSGEIIDWGSGSIIVDEGNDSSNEEGSDGSTSFKITPSDFTNANTSLYTFTNNEIEFKSSFYNSSSLIYCESNGYLYNIKAIEGLSKIVISFNVITSSTYVSVYTGTKEKPTTSNTSSRDIDGNIYTYTVLSGEYINITTSNICTINYIEFICESSN